MEGDRRGGGGGEVATKKEGRRKSVLFFFFFFFFFFFLLVFVQVGLCDLFSFRRFEVTADSVVLAVSLVG